MNDEEDVPILDFSSSSSESLSKKLHQACARSGFFYATGVPSVLEKARRARKVCDAFFRRDVETKMRCFSLKKGYVPINGTENAVRKPEFHEKFSCGRLLESYERSNDPYYDPNRSLFFDCENTFPRNVFGVTREKGEEDAFEEAYSSLYREMERFSEQLLRVFAMSLNMKEEELEYFVERSRKHVTNLVALRYDVSRAKRTLKKKEEDEDDTLLVRAHTDPTDFTCLFFDDERGPNGLQILIEEEEGGARGESRWIDVPKVPNAMLVNVGDVLMAWTNGEYKSTRHRVILNRNSNKEEEEEEEEEEESRLSLVWFHCPNYDALIDSRDVDARKKNLSNTTPPKYAPFLCKDRTHFQQTERTKRGLKDRQLTSTHDTRVRGLDVENS
jgi:isopenicillin N synthase-like dioxygenase|tara:strand:- start:2916 stop:4076 length:1161 start_codon:yes stop_codon:yes gene_type:complete